MTTETAKRALPELRAWMKQTGTNQAALGRLLGLSESMVSLVIRGLRPLSIDHALQLALLTGIPVEKLLTGGSASRLLKLLGKRMNSSAAKDRHNDNVA